MFGLNEVYIAVVDLSKLKSLMDGRSLDESKTPLAIIKAWGNNNQKTFRRETVPAHEIIVCQKDRINEKLLEIKEGKKLITGISRKKLYDCYKTNYGQLRFHFLDEKKIESLKEKQPKYIKFRGSVAEITQTYALKEHDLKDGFFSFSR